jgi:hypothetical protein
MQSDLIGIVALGVCSLAAGCASAPPPATRAARVEQVQCDSSGTAQEALVRSTKVLSVQPLYSHIISGKTAEQRVDGATLLVRPPQGVDAEQMTRILQCHSARVLLGQVNRDAVRNDPYWLPDSWVNIQVKPESGNFAVTLSTDTVHDGLQVLGHANQYADDHTLAAEPELP